MANTDILYIEDNFHNRRIVRKILERQGYSLHEREDGLEGYETLKEMKPGIVLLDISLPSMDGMEIAGLVKADPELEHIYLIALTASAMQGDRERFLDGGCDDYLSKPFRALDLVDMVGKYMARIEGDISVPDSPPQPSEMHENGKIDFEEAEPALVAEVVETTPVVPPVESAPVEEKAESVLPKVVESSVEAVPEAGVELVDAQSLSTEAEEIQMDDTAELVLPAEGSAVCSG